MKNGLEMDNKEKYLFFANKLLYKRVKYRL